MTNIITTIGTVLTAAIGWVGDVVASLFGETGKLKDLTGFLALGLGIAVLGIGIGYVRSFVRLRKN